MTSNSALLRLLNLPVFTTAKDLATLIRVETETIVTYSRYPSRFYKRYDIPKARGGTRNIQQPNKTMKALQSWILRNILDKLTPSEYATAYCLGKGLLENVLPHKSNRFFVCIDIEDFFPSISFYQILKLFRLAGYEGSTSRILAKLCTCENGLPQGGITSPAISNLIASRLDRRIAGLCNRRSIAFTRYSDDITLSSNNPKILRASIPNVLNILVSEHFRPNASKMKIVGPYTRCSITGLIKNSTLPKFGIGRTKKREMRALLHHKETGKPITSKYMTTESIHGWLSYVASVDKESYEQITGYWDRLIEKYSKTPQ